MPISVSATADDLKEALETLPTAGDVLVSRTELVEPYGYAWTVTFLSSDWWTGGDAFYAVPQMLLSPFDGTYITEYKAGLVNSSLTATKGRLNTLKGTNTRVTVNTLVQAMSGYEQQMVQIEATSGYLIGTFSLMFNGSSTPPLPVNSTDADIASALELIPGSYGGR